jgi:hypothetical protein
MDISPLKMGTSFVFLGAGSLFISNFITKKIKYKFDQYTIKTNNKR